MRAVVQRVSEAVVRVGAEDVANIGAGLLILLGVMEGDREEDVEYLATKCAELRIFSDDAGKMNRSVLDVRGQVIVVSQFTLAANTRKGRRPSFIEAADPSEAVRRVDQFCERLRAVGLECQTGRFGADMRVGLTNDGPVTIWLDTAQRLASTGDLPRSSND